MVLKDCQEGWLVTDVCDFIVVEVVESLHKRCRSSEQCDQGCLIVGYEAVETLSVMSHTILVGYFTMNIPKSSFQRSQQHYSVKSKRCWGWYRYWSTSKDLEIRKCDSSIGVGRSPRKQGWRH